MTDAEGFAHAHAHDDPDGAADAVTSMLKVMDLSPSARTTEDIFTGTSQPMPTGRVFGGQVLAQSIVAASRTLAPERVPHSMHGYFLRPGDASRGITFAVDRIHDGRSFSTRRTQAYQDGVPLFSMIASFQDEESGLEHHTPMPADVPEPEDLLGLADHLAQLGEPIRRLFMDHAVDVRHVPAPIYLLPDAQSAAHQSVWMRIRSPLPDDPVIHRATLAYLSDLTIQESVLRAHGISWAADGLKVASLDHGMWWHRFGRVDEWCLYVQESPSARGGRGLATGRVYSRGGELLASVAQEIMIRLPSRQRS